MALAVLGSGEGDEFLTRMAWLEMTGEFDGMPEVRNLEVDLDPDPLTSPRLAPLVYPAGRLASFLLELPPGFDFS